MDEVLPGVHHWTSIHPKIHIEVSSYWLDEGVAIDPLIPEPEGIEWFAGRPVAPVAVLLSNRHHYRDSAVFAERFGCAVHCNERGLHEFGGGEKVTGFDFGDALPGGAVAQEVAGICPDDTGLFLPAARALVFADAVVRGGPHGQDGALGFVPDSLMDDPPLTKRRILASCERLLADLEFDHLLLAHGGPLIGDGRAQLADLLASGGRTAFEL
jgi:glyoxylase-like metal-dependent hydrolase (beta-lactamase superfamily II)